MWFTRPDGRTHDIGKLPGPGDRPSFASSNNRLCNLFSKPFFPIAIQYLPQFGFACAGEPFRCGDTPGTVHAHVQRPVTAKGKSSVCAVELRRRDTDVEKNAVDSCHSERAHLRFEFAERRVHEGETTVLDRSTGFDRIGIAIECEQAPAGAELLENPARMSASSERGVDKDSSRPVADTEGLKHFFGENWEVAIGVQSALVTVRSSRCRVAERTPPA